MIKIQSAGNRHGFHMTFPNGWTASVQIGYGSYCDNNHNVTANPECANAEVAAWDANGDFYKFDYDSVEGYKDAAEVAKFIMMVSEFTGNAEAVNAIRDVHSE